MSRFPSWAEMMAAVGDRSDTRMSSAVRAKLAGASDYLAVAPTVVTVAPDAPLDRSGPVTPLPHHPADPDALAALAERWSLSGSVDRLVAALAADDEG